ncbi:RNase adapter RapZ [Thermodesulfobacteriota bacterium]
MANDLNIIIVTGLSGSGKSTVLNMLEDLDFYCVDNLPVALFFKFFELCAQSNNEITNVAIGMDIRERDFFNNFPEILNDLKQSGHNFELIFLDSSDDILVRRYSETRRSHPLSCEGGSVSDSIKKERELLEGVKAIATRVIDTTKINVHQLKEMIRGHFSDLSSDHAMRISVVSFGFKNGPPNFADLMFDVRFMVNPYFVPELKPLSGLDDVIQDFIFKDNDISNEFLNKLLDLLSFLIPQYEKEGKRYLTIAIGCTGGQHRSVAVAYRINKYLEKDYDSIALSHRDVKFLKDN